MQIPVAEKNSVRVECSSCGKISLISELSRNEPNWRLPNPAGGSWAVVYYQCACQKFLVYEPGDGGDLVLQNSTKVVKQEELMAYRVAWSRPKSSQSETKAGEFSAKDNEGALQLLKKNFQEDQRYVGDTLVLYRIVVKEEIEVVATVDAIQEDDTFLG